MSKMVERVARVINELANVNFHAYTIGKDESIVLARAAIAAMRDPTQDMQDALRPRMQQRIDLGNGQTIAGPGLADPSPIDDWRAMIDEALK